MKQAYKVTLTNQDNAWCFQHTIMAVSAASAIRTFKRGYYAHGGKCPRHDAHGLVLDGSGDKITVEVQ